MHRGELVSRARSPAYSVRRSTGLHNDDLDLCHTLLTIPTNPDFSSLNLAMAVQVLTYELRMAGVIVEIAARCEFRKRRCRRRPARTWSISTLTSSEVLRRRSVFSIRKIPASDAASAAAVHVRARPDKNEVNILRGILTAVDRKRQPE